MEVDANNQDGGPEAVVHIDPSMISSSVDASQPDSRVYPPESEEIFCAEEFINQLVQIGAEMQRMAASMRILRRQLRRFYMAIDGAMNSVAWERLGVATSELQTLRSHMSLARALLSQEIRALDNVIRSGELRN